MNSRLIYPCNLRRTLLGPKPYRMQDDMELSYRLFSKAGCPMIPLRLGLPLPVRISKLRAGPEVVGLLGPWVQTI